ncbi:hypothetical protein [Xanthomonas floridensis]|uniref:Uncharacterized protein n=1 Tax=Xanthomonas floridensis TaxID=1843580 RepID=A0A1A9MC07_9XANT|nr:hypothetical protein [Xanthomonas floridensis]MEA5123323.1 hypothetical protein [Xanthomonas floridensis]MEA5132710.1 hypothetical protein [Xanthomonas floridensis]OAG67718.1 hypothetical protein A7D17_16155 [Xanthomonas floridensis]
MARGIRQRDLAGNILIDISTRMPSKSGAVTIAAGSSGSVAVPALGTNEIHFWFSASSSAQYAQAPLFTVNEQAGTISWNYGGGSNQGTQIGGVLTYGRY